MGDMLVLKCKMCGGDLRYEQGTTVCSCEYCGSKQTIPVIDDEKKGLLYERANRLRSNCEFDKASMVYESIIKDYPQDAESYWGLLLCKFGIEYVDDPTTGNKIPTCHRSSFESIMDDPDFEVIMENSDSEARAVYREQAKQIEAIRKGILEVSGKEEPYDIFICYKETAEDGQRTIDSVIAQDVYDQLVMKGYRVFFSRITLEDKLGTEYEPYIFAALNSAKIMLAFGTTYDYYNAVWVKNEWSRFLKLMVNDKSKYLIPCYKDIDAYDIPKEFKHLQAQDMGKVGAIQDLLRGIEKILGERNKTQKVSEANEKKGFDLGYEEEMGRIKAREEYEEKQRREREERERLEEEKRKRIEEENKRKEEEQRRQTEERARREAEELRAIKAEEERREVINNNMEELKKKIKKYSPYTMLISFLVVILVYSVSVSSETPTSDATSTFALLTSCVCAFLIKINSFKKATYAFLLFEILAFVGMFTSGWNILSVAMGAVMVLLLVKYDSLRREVETK